MNAKHETSQADRFLASTHEVENQPHELVDYDMYAEDAALRDRFAAMRGFFEGVGQGATAGVWQGVPRTHPEFKVEFRRRVDKQRRRDAEEAV